MFNSPAVRPPGSALPGGGARHFASPASTIQVMGRPTLRIGSVSVAGGPMASVTGRTSGELVSSPADAHDRQDGEYPSVAIFKACPVFPNTTDRELLVQKGCPILFKKNCPTLKAETGADYIAYFGGNNPDGSPRKYTITKPDDARTLFVGADPSRDAAIGRIRQSVPNGLVARDEYGIESYLTDADSTVLAFATEQMVLKKDVKRATHHYRGSKAKAASVDNFITGTFNPDSRIDPPAGTFTWQLGDVQHLACALEHMVNMHLAVRTKHLAGTLIESGVDLVYEQKATPLRGGTAPDPTLEFEIKSQPVSFSNYAHPGRQRPSQFGRGRPAAIPGSLQTDKAFWPLRSGTLLVPAEPMFNGMTSRVALAAQPFLYKGY